MDPCRQLLEVGEGVYLAVGRKGEVLFASSSFSKLPTQSVGELSQQSLLAACKRVAESQSAESFELPSRDSSGAERWFSCVVSPTPESNEFSVAAVCHDVTNQKNEIANQCSALDATADGILVTDRAGYIVRFNQRLLDIWQIPASVVSGRFYKESLTLVLEQLERPEYCVQTLEKIMSRPDGLSDDVLKLKDGKIIERFSRPQWLNGKIIGRVFSYRDITARVKAEEDARESARRLKTLAETSRLVAEARLDLQAVLDSAARTVSEFFQDGCVIRLITAGGFEVETVSSWHVDPEFREAFEKRVAPLREFLDRETSLEILQSHQPLLLSGSVELIRSHLHADLRGMLDRFPVHSWIISPLRVAGQVIGFMSTFRMRAGFYSQQDVEFLQDLSDRTALAISNVTFHLETKNALRLRDDFILLASHELRNPLTALSLQMQFLKKRAPQSDLLERCVGESADNVNRLTRLVEEMLKMASLATGSVGLILERTDLTRLLTESLDRYRPRFNAVHATVSLEADQSVFGEWDAARIQEVIDDLLLTTLSFAKDKSIRITLSRNLEQARLEIWVGTVGARAEVSYRSLTGFDREVAIEQLGLGIYIANEIIGLHGGRFWIQGELSKEFSVIIELPVRTRGALGAA